jgi:hypothetical protein
MPIYNNALAQQPANRLAYQDRISATPRNEYLGALADFLAQSYAPQRTQQMQGVAEFLQVPAISQTLDRLSYGEPLTTGAGGLGGTTRVRPEAIDAAMALAPLYRPAGMVAKGAEQATMAAGKAGERYAEKVLPGIMERGGLPAQLALDLTQGSRRQIFVGEKSKTWNAANAAKAVEMEKAGASPQDIWMATQTFRGPEGKLRQEISDTGSIPGQRLYSWGEGKDLEQGNSTVVRRQKALLHPELSAAYPDTKNIGVSLRPGRQGGFYNSSMDNIGAPVSAENKAADRSVMLHELQHAIQEREGFAEGGSPDTMVLALEKIAEQKRQQAQDLFRMSSANDPLDPTKIVKPGARKKGLQLEKEARELDSKALMAYQSEQAKFDLYQRLAGEAEARAVQKRMNMTDTQRRVIFPYESYDVPINQLIVRTK